MQQRLARKPFLLKLSSKFYSIDQQSPIWKQFPMDGQTIQYLDQKNIKSHELIDGLSIWLNAALIHTMRFTHRTTFVIMGIFILAVIGISIGAILEIDWLGVAAFIIGIVGSVVYIIVAIVLFKKKVNEIRESLSCRISSSERDHHVRVEEVFAQGFPCCPPVLPQMLNIFKNDQ